MNLERIYQHRFAAVNQKNKLSSWKIISEFIYKKLGEPKSILDPAAGNCEFINQVPSEECWAVDISDFIKKSAHEKVKLIIGDNLNVELPENYFEGIFISNFLEHLRSQEEVALFLERMYKTLKTGGRIAIMGPNFKYCAANYFDFADHTVILTETSIAEHLYGAGFKIEKIHPKFLPLSFRSKIPAWNFLIKSYLALPFAWVFMGKQFLLIAKK